MNTMECSSLCKWVQSALERANPASEIQVGIAHIEGWRLVLLRPYGLGCGEVPKGHGRLASIGGEVDYHTALYQLLEVAISAAESIIGPQPRQFFVDKDGGDDRAWANATGLVFYGRHQLVIHPILGSAINIGSATLAVPEAIAAAWQQQEPKAQRSLCGSCSQCVEACPTGALAVGQRGLNLAHCRSAINQKKGDITPLEAEYMGEWLYGCDLCQIACPFNKKRLVPGVESLPLHSLEGLTNKTFKLHYGHRAFAYLGLPRLKRNVALVQDWQQRNR